MITPRHTIARAQLTTEDGWLPAPRIEPGDPLLVWRTVPGSNVSLQVRNDHAGTVMLAYAADYNAYVEPLVDSMTACYTPTNSVSTSNHLNATAMDFNWGYYPWKQRGNLSGDKLVRLRDLLGYWQGIMFWAGDWDDAYVDEMHHQMDYGSYDLERSGQLAQWIRDHIRPDGFSTYKRGGGSPQAPSVDAAKVLAAAAGISADKATQILPALSAGLKLAQCTTVNRIAMFVAQTCWEADHYNTTEEYGDLSGQQFYPYIGRTWIQITWESNYAAFGQWCADNGLISDPNQFVDDPQSLADIRWAGVGAAWYWTVQRPGINGMCDAGDIVGVTKAINGGTNGLDQRTALWNQALAQGDALLSLLDTQGDEDEMAGWTSDLVDRAMVLLENQTGVVRPSRSPFRHVGEGPVDTCGGFAWAADGNVHAGLVAYLAVEFGDPTSILLLWEVAQCIDANRAQDAALATRVLAKVDQADVNAASLQLAAWLAAEKKANTK